MKQRKSFKTKLMIILAVSVVLALLLSVVLVFKNNKKSNKVSFRIIATSDLHGKMRSYDYLAHEFDISGSVCQLSTAVRYYRNKNTVLVDVGDAIQGNSAELFLDDQVHPMIKALNKMGYDFEVLGNHEFDYDPDKIDKYINGFNGTVLTGNLYKKDGSRVCDGYKIVKKNGIRIAFIGMTTPNSAGWSKADKEELQVTDPLEETKKIIKEIQGQYDVLVGLYHMDINNEYDIPNSGVTDICNACPEFDIMVASHGHRKIEGEIINGVLVVENLDRAQTMSVIDVDMKKTKKGWSVKKKKSESITVKNFPADPEMMYLFEGYDRRAKEDAMTVIGKLEKGPMVMDISEVDVPVSDPKNTAVTYLTDTPEIELINTVLMNYADCSISCTANNDAASNIMPGDIHKCDISQIYKYSNNLCKVHMSGAQLKKFLEYNANCYKTYHKGDKGVAIEDDSPIYSYYMFDGIKYEIDVSQEKGSRIKNLTDMSGTPIKDTDEMDVAVNGYLANSTLLAPGALYESNDMPSLVEADIHAEKGGIRELIIDYIKNDQDGLIYPDCDYNWKLTGY
ncbi:MAG: 5'-nucleotidase C-terminal domain-containing protein [Eubacterium sp.]|nr:5'-nucleotidase C-terminal domain-containing protein [Eubacterium sp.]